MLSSKIVLQNKWPRFYFKAIFFEAIFFCLPILWWMGLNVMDLARLFLIVIAYLYLKYPEVRKFAFVPSKLKLNLLCILIISFLVLLPLELNLRNFLGHTVNDTNIFNQAAVNFANHGRFWVTLNRAGQNDFLADHVSPILLIPAFFYKLGIPAYSISIVFQQICFLIGSYFAIKILKELKFDIFSSLLILLLLLYQPTFRSQLTWSVQVEYMSFPFIAASYFFWLKDKNWLSVFTAVLSWSCKESLACWSVGFGLFALAYLLVYRRNYFWQKSLPFLVLTISGSFYFYLVIYHHSLFFGRDYDYLSRLDFTWIWQNPLLVFKKLRYLCFFIASVFFIPIQKPKYLIFLLPVLPNFGMSLVSGFDDMYEISKQYALFPAMILFLTTILATKVLFPIKKNSILKLPLVPCCLLMCFYFSFLSLRPMKIFKEWIFEDFYHADDFTQIPLTENVFATLKSAPFLLDRKGVFLSDYDSKLSYALVHHSEISKIPQTIIEKTSICLDTKEWYARCAN